MLDVGDRGLGDGELADSQRMDDAEIASHSNVFIMAGYETTSNALTFTSYLLASHQTIQEKLQREIDEYFHKNGVKYLHAISLPVLSISMVSLKN